MIAGKENASIKLIVDDKSHLLAYRSGNLVPVDESCHHLSDTAIQMKPKGKNTYCSTNILNHTLSMCLKQDANKYMDY